MFYICKSLKKLNISNFVFNDSNNVKYMFSKCSEELKRRIKKQYKKISENAFIDYEEDTFNYDYLPNISYEELFN